MCSWCSVGNGVAGVGLVKAVTSSWAASRAASAEEVAGMVQCVGKNSTVGLCNAIRSLDYSPI
jgi:hypothetical protein